jgi:hypothetical protein
LSASGLPGVQCSVARLADLPLPSLATGVTRQAGSAAPDVLFHCGSFADAVVGPWSRARCRLRSVSGARRLRSTDRSPGWSDEAARRDSATVRGEYWTNECNDAVVCGGCPVTTARGDAPERPLRNITVLMTPAKGQEVARVVLAEGVDAASDLTFDLEVVVPPQTRPGGYRLAAHSVGGDLFLGPRIRVVD